MLWRANSTRKRNAYRILAGLFPLRPMVIVCLAVAARTQAAPAIDPVEFNRDIRPIFSDRCYTCHGPSQSTRMSKLRLDVPAGEATRKEILRRVSLGDKPGRMPAAGPELAPHEV